MDDFCESEDQCLMWSFWHQIWLNENVVSRKRFFIQLSLLLIFLKHTLYNINILQRGIRKILLRRLQRACRLLKMITSSWMCSWISFSVIRVNYDLSLTLWVALSKKKLHENFGLQILSQFVLQHLFSSFFLFELLQAGSLCKQKNNTKQNYLFKIGLSPSCSSGQNELWFGVELLSTGAI